MAITLRTDYAVRLMYELAQIPFGASISVRDLCEVADVPQSFGASLVPFIVEAGLVETRGHNNHLLSLALPAEQISISRIVCACEPEFSLAQCAREPQSCERSSRCGAHVMWVDLDRVVREYLASVTLAQLAATAPLAPSVYLGRMPTGCPDRSGIA